MKVLIVLSVFYGLIYLWLYLKYRAETANERYLNKKIKQAGDTWVGVDCDEYMNELRDYDSRCQIEAERKERDER